ncbi:MAG: tetratricopeptide repeat protein [Elusimicrobia bacterium]|nr:tetratricopeptide repeat protein [Elusimicrobiota bacterium]
MKPRLAGLIGAAFMAAYPLPGWATPFSDAYAAVEAASSLAEKAGRCYKAIPLWQKDDGADQLGTCNLAVALYLSQNGKAKEALPFAQAAVRLEPKRFGSQNVLGIILNTLHRHGEAVEALRTAVRLEPQQSAAYGSMCAALAEMKRYSEALGACEKSMELGEKDPTVFVHRGYAYAGMGKLDEAAADFERARLLFTGGDLSGHAADAGAPSQLLAQDGMAWVTFLRGDAAGAEREFSAVIKARHQNPRVWWHRAQAYMALRRHPEAVADLGTVLDLDPEFAEAYELRGTYYAGSGAPDLAAKDLGAACDKGSRSACEKRAQLNGP